MESESVTAGPSTGDGVQGLSDAERLRQRRRAKILANQDSRLEKILGSENTRAKSSKTKVKTEDPPMEDVTDSWRSGSAFVGTTDGTDFVNQAEEVVNIYRRRATIPADSLNDPLETSSGSQPVTAPSTVPETIHSGQESPSSPALGFFAPLADGSTIHPKIPSWACRLLLCVLAMCLSVFNARYMMVTFFSWEIGVLSINGMHGDESPSSVLILLVALMGLKEPQLRRLKFALKFSNSIITDLSLFIVFSLIPRILI